MKNSKTQPTVNTRNRNTAEINFRTKFENMIPEGMHSQFEKAVRTMNSMESEKALSLLWTLTYNPEAGTNTFGFTTIDPSSTVENIMVDETKPDKVLTLIPNNLVRPFRNELRYQYDLANKGSNLLDIYIPDSCKEAYKALYVATDDPITSVVAFEACLAVCKSSDEQSVERCIALLGNPKEQNFFGGIRSLHFGYDAANYLKPYATQLCNLVSALWEEEKAHHNISSNLPMAKLGEMLQTNGVILPEDNIVETEVKTATCSNQEPSRVQHEEATHVTASAITANKELFEKFLLAKDLFASAVKSLEEAGFDRDEVAEKAEAISKILEAFQLLE